MPLECVYPLEWPAGWETTRAQSRKRARYTVSFERAQKDLYRELTLLDSSNKDLAVISSDVPVRKDGMFYANLRNPDNPGVSVFFYREGIQRVIACDTWDLIKDNIRALGLTIEALRALERTGSSGIMDRAYSGFARLPDLNADIQHWSYHLEMSNIPLTVENVENQFRKLAQIYHPDKPLGDAEKFNALCQARKEAINELKGSERL